MSASELSRSRQPETSRLAIVATKIIGSIREGGRAQNRILGGAEVGEVEIEGRRVIKNLGMVG